MATKNTYFWGFMGLVILVALAFAVESGLSTQYGAPNTTAINATAQQMQALEYGLTLPSSYFQCGQSSSCEKILVSPCDNGEPSQFACINKQYYANYTAAYNSSVAPKSSVCALYIVDSNITCSCNANTHSCDENYKSI